MQGFTPIFSKGRNFSLPLEDTRLLHCVLELVDTGSEAAIKEGVLKQGIGVL